MREQNMTNESPQNEIYWCRKCSKSIESASRECPVCGDKMFDPASIKAEGMFLTFIGVGLTGLLGILLILILTAVLFGKGQKDLISVFAIVASIILFLLPSVIMAKIGIKRWKSGKINTEEQNLLKSSFKSLR